MSGFIGQEILSQIRAANDIVEVVQWLNVPLKKAGNSFRALCPFHKEKTPSFHVSPQRQSFHCFGCGVGGDVFKFLMLREGLDFPSAAYRLAERAHITIPETSKAEWGLNRQQRDQLYELLNRVKDWFHTNLMRSRQAEQARAYLKQRGFSAETAKQFSLGYSLPAWDGLIQWSRKEKIDLNLLQEAGLIIVNENKHYDRFRDRLMIPISDEFGRVVGFSGRLLADRAKEAKYVNSPETTVFKKGRLLFGLHHSKRELQETKTAILCEGQLDWIRCFEAGIRNVIAPQGTAFTEDQARILKRYAEQVILCFDSDVAGQKATWRNAEILIRSGLSVRATRMPDGEDPDSFIRKFGAAKMKHLLEEAIDIFEYRALALLKSLNMRDPRSHQKVVIEMTPLLNLVDNEPQRQRIIHNVCDLLTIDPMAFLTEFKRQQRLIQRSSEEPGKEPSRLSITEHFEDQINTFGDYFLHLSLTEEAAARLLANHLNEIWLQDYGLRHVLFHIIQKIKQGLWKPGWENLDLTLDESDKEKIARLFTHSMPMNRRALAIGLQEAMIGIQRLYLNEQYQERSRLLKNANLSDEDRLRFQTELLDLGRQIKQL